jgi:hypothetical protein
MNRLEIFKDELNLLDEKYKVFASYFINTLPDYFFLMPASTSGKYHPKYCLGEGGLVKHVKATIKVAESLFRMQEFNFNKKNQNLIYVALLLHDGFKQGYDPEGHTLTEHPVIIAKEILKNKNSYNIIGILNTLYLASLVWTHMGKWNTNKEGKVIMPKPFTKMQKFVHLCDYLASRKFLEVQLEESAQIPKEISNIG